MTLEILNQTSGTLNNSTPSDRLRLSGGVWSSTPDYSDFGAKRQFAHFAQFDQILKAILEQGEYNAADVQKAYDETMLFFERAHNDFRSEELLMDIGGRAFAVPMRISRNPDDSYASEVTPFAPLLSPEFGIDSDIRQRAVVGLPPAILDRYELGDGPDRRGGLLLVPIFEDMYSDVVTATDGLRRINQIKRLREITQVNIDLSASFARKKMGAAVMGLGALIPSLTKFGTTIQEKELVTTTGHGGTVHLLVETVRDASVERNTDLNVIGVLGGGSIGGSATDVALEYYPDVKFNVYDPDTSRFNRFKDMERVSIMNSVKEILMTSDIVITAIDSTIDLDKVDPDKAIDLSGKYIVDDSQPGSFLREQVEARGGKLVWVVGQDASPDRLLTLTSGYNFGDTAGLLGSRDMSAVWGCEAEAAVLAATGYYDLALKSRVTPTSARAIGNLMRDIGVHPAPLQSYGRYVN